MPLERSAPPGGCAGGGPHRAAPHAAGTAAAGAPWRAARQYTAPPEEAHQGPPGSADRRVKAGAEKMVSTIVLFLNRDLNLVDTIPGGVPIRRVFLHLVDTTVFSGHHPLVDTTVFSGHHPLVDTTVYSGHHPLVDTTLFSGHHPLVNTTSFSGQHPLNLFCEVFYSILGVESVQKVALTTKSCLFCRALAKGA